MYKIKALNKISEKGLSLFSNEYEMIDDVNAAAGILVRSQDMHEAELPDELLAVARAGAGVNNIPIDRCSEQGIVVFNTPGANANAVKELVLAGLLLTSRDILEGVCWVQTLDNDLSKTVEKGKSRFSGHEIMGKTLGVIGLGAIGVLVANAASALGMKVVGFDPYVSVKAALELSNKIQLAESLESLVASCDYLTIHVPAVEGTKGMINKSIFDQMKDHTCLLNFARDSIVDADALAEALASGRVYRYITDFPSEKTIHLDHVISVPHLGASTEESEDNCAVMAVEQLMDYLENGNITNSVNFPNCSMGICCTAARISVLHKNIPSMIGKITSHLAAMEINISDMTNRSKGAYQYTLLDVDSPIENSHLDNLRAIEGIISARIIK